MAHRLRVVAGSAGGLHLAAPKGARPTTDRAKEALFASLGDLVEGATVLDLFAGSGALGIEALSRGADRATFVDRDRHAAEAIRTNLATTGFADPARARVVSQPVTAFLGATSGVGREWRPYDLLFLDPPYETGAGALTTLLGRVEEGGWPAPGATVVVECRATNRPALPSGWQVPSERRYGDTLLLVATV